MGLPMTLLCNARQREPELLDGETRAFLDTLADEDGWQNTYRRSDYNSIKFTFFREKIQSQTMTSLLSMAARTAAADPRLAFETFNEVTGLVWDVSGQDRSYQRVTNSGDLDVAQKAPRQFHAVGQAVTDFLSAPLEFLPLRWLSPEHRRAAAAPVARDPVDAVPRRHGKAFAGLSPPVLLSGHHAAALRAGRTVLLLCGGSDAPVPVRPAVPAISRKNRLFCQNSRKES